MREEPLPLIKDKFDTDTARKLIARGYPGIAPVLPYMLEWIQDCNWPVAQVVHPFLTSLGRPLVSEIRRVLATDDDVWKYWCISVLKKMDLAVAEALKPELSLIANEPTKGESIEGVDREAKELLDRFDAQRERE